SSSHYVTDTGNQFLRARFTKIVPSRPYTLKIDPGMGPDGKRVTPYYIFNGVILPQEDPEYATLREDTEYTGGEEIDTDELPEDDGPSVDDDSGLAYGLPPTDEPTGELFDEQAEPEDLDGSAGKTPGPA
ncbi:MAG: hypothetical protein WBE26_17320, partial [Phycisphaerae bacterium]